MRHFRLEYILLYLHRISVFTQNLGQTLAENSISIFAISTYNTDYVLITQENYQKALDILGYSGYEVVE